MKERATAKPHTSVLKHGHEFVKEILKAAIPKRPFVSARSFVVLVANFSRRKTGDELPIGGDETIGSTAGYVQIRNLFRFRKLDHLENVIVDPRAVVGWPIDFEQLSSKRRDLRIKVVWCIKRTTKATNHSKQLRILKSKLEGAIPAHRQPGY